MTTETMTKKMSGYTGFLESKLKIDKPTGFDPDALGGHLFDFQRDIVRWALRRGRAAIFADTGMGKTAMQLEWAHRVPGDILIVAPLAVAHQTIAEGEKFGVVVGFNNEGDRSGKITITNYENLHKFSPDDFSGVVLDESSILKSQTAKYRNYIIDVWGRVPYRLACTATPAPNDFMELGNHSEFLNVMSQSEMLAQYFVHDGGETQKWRLKGHAESEFWKWITQWAVMIRKPSDLGYEDKGYILPELTIKQHTVDVEHSGPYLFAMEARGLQDRQKARRESIEERADRLADIVRDTPGPWLIWCNLNSEADAICKRLPGAINVQGSDRPELKAERLLGFARGDFEILVTKPMIAGFGMNWQHCNNMGFLGLSDSYEQFYQAVRRCYRFGQKKPVNVHVVTATTEGAVVSNIKRKEAEAAKMAEEMVKNTQDITKAELEQTSHQKNEYKTDSVESKRFTAYMGDCVEVTQTLADDSIHYSVFSPPFASLYTYSNSERDMGNCQGDNEFYTHFGYLIQDLYRVLKPGRLVSFHCMNLPTSKANHGFIGIRDFRGELIRRFQDSGFIYHSEVCIWKDPVIAMQRTKALGLLHKQLKKDSCMSRQGIPDYLVTMRKPGENPEPVTNTNESFPVHLWQKYASPIWTDINPSDTLQYRSARDHKDEKHICPLQLQVIDRALKLWTNKDDLVLSPFMGIGSEGYCALRMGRRFVGIELKESYYKQAVRNLKEAEEWKDTGALFDVSEFSTEEEMAV